MPTISLALDYVQGIRRLLDSWTVYSVFPLARAAVELLVCGPSHPSRRSRLMSRRRETGVSRAATARHYRGVTIAPVGRGGGAKLRLRRQDREVVAAFDSEACPAEQD